MAKKTLDKEIKEYLNSELFKTSKERIKGYISDLYGIYLKTQFYNEDIISNKEYIIFKANFIKECANMCGDLVYHVSDENLDDLQNITELIQIEGFKLIDSIT